MDSTESCLNSCPEINNMKMLMVVAAIAVAELLVWALMKSPIAIISPPNKFTKSNPPQRTCGVAKFWNCDSDGQIFLAISGKKHTTNHRDIYTVYMAMNLLNIMKKLL